MSDRTTATREAETCEGQSEQCQRAGFRNGNARRRAHEGLGAAVGKRLHVNTDAQITAAEAAQHRGKARREREAGDEYRLRVRRAQAGRLCDHEDRSALIMLNAIIDWSNALNDGRTYENLPELSRRSHLVPKG